jgi:hypothetical protein
VGLPAGRDRFVAFAFAAADLLLEAAADGQVIFATGAFPARLGRPAECSWAAPPGRWWRRPTGQPSTLPFGACWRMGGWRPCGSGSTAAPGSTWP